MIASVLAIFSLMLSDFFDTMGTAFGLATEAELLDDDGQIPHFESILVVDSLPPSPAARRPRRATPPTSSPRRESARALARVSPRWSRVALFLVAMLFSPLVTIVPYEAATPALVVVGFLMMTQIRHIDFTDYSIGIPAFLTITLMPFTYSITNGIGAGFVTWVVIQMALGRARQRQLADVGHLDRLPGVLRDLPARDGPRPEVVPLNRRGRWGRCVGWRHGSADSTLRHARRPDLADGRRGRRLPAALVACDASSQHWPCWVPPASSAACRGPRPRMASPRCAGSQTSASPRSAG